MRTHAGNTVGPRQARGRASAADLDGTSHSASAAAAATQRLQQMAAGSPRALQLERNAALAGADAHTTILQAVQRLADRSARTAQLQPTAGPATSSTAAPASGGNRIGLPASLMGGIEALSGIRMDHVTVHYNSARPAQLAAHAYAQGSEIHLAPGQEHHLPHEAWHLVQQAQGRVQPTLQAGDVAVNDDAGLEREADAMGSQAARAGVHETGRDGHDARAPRHFGGVNIAQRVVYPNVNAMWQAVAPPFTVANIMAVINGNAALANHYQAVIGHLNLMNFVQMAGVEPNAAPRPNAGGTYDINYDIPANQPGRFAHEEFFVGAIIHEMGHVASSQLYNTNIGPGPGTDYHVANMHLPALVGAPFAGQQFGLNQLSDPVAGMDAQEATMDANWNVLANLLAGSSDFSLAERQLLQGRIDYGRGASPYAHYDTVLADILFYLQHQHMDATHFYAQASAMLHEANLRRAAGAGVVANVALVGAPAQDTATLHAAVGQLLGDARWSGKGEALIGHKTPDGIVRLRAVFAQPNMREALEDVRATAAVIAATPSRRRIAVTQQAYQALSADDRAAGLALTVAAVNAARAQL